MNKLTSRRGETLTETLVAVLIIALAAVLLGTMTAAAGRLSRAAWENDAAFYAELSAAELGSGTDGAGAKVTVNGTHSDTIPVTVTGGDGALRAYRAR